VIRRAYDWLVSEWHWPYAAAFTGALLVLFAPLLFSIDPAEAVIACIIFLQMPLYMVHQWEEHRGDSFRHWVNTHVGAGREVLTRPATFVINSVGVWGIDLLAFYLAVFVDAGWGLIALYLPAVNAVGHIVPAVITRRYNPGLWSAVFGFLPLSWGGIAYLSRALDPTLLMQVVSLGVAVAVHAAILGYVQSRLHALAAKA